MDVPLSNSNARKSGSFSSGILRAGGAQAPTQTFTSFSGSLVGTVLRVTIASCTLSA